MVCFPAMVPTSRQPEGYTTEKPSERIFFAEQVRMYDACPTPLVCFDAWCGKTDCGGKQNRYPINNPMPSV